MAPQSADDWGTRHPPVFVPTLVFNISTLLVVCRDGRISAPAIQIWPDFQGRVNLWGGADLVFQRCDWTAMV